jgi:hypothetical protein
MEEHKMLSAWVVKDLSRGPAFAGATKADNLPQQAEVWFVCYEREHDEVGIQAVHAVGLVGSVVWALLSHADGFHDLMFTLTRHIMTCKDRRLTKQHFTMLDNTQMCMIPGLRRSLQS